MWLILGRLRAWPLFHHRETNVCRNSYRRKFPAAFLKYAQALRVWPSDGNHHSSTVTELFFPSAGNGFDSTGGDNSREGSVIGQSIDSISCMQKDTIACDLRA